MGYKILLILIAVLLSTNFVLAGEIEFDYPSEAQIEQEFSVSLKLIDFDSDIYDVKIDITSGGDRIARILNDGVWKSTYYYLNEAIGNDEEKEFSMRIIEDFEEANILVKVRNSYGASESFSNYNILKKGSSAGSASNDGESQEVEEENETQEIIEKKQEEAIDEENNEDISVQVISLNPKDINSEESNENSSIFEGNYALYGLFVFSILLIVLLLIKMLKTKRENTNEFG